MTVPDPSHQGTATPPPPAPAPAPSPRPKLAEEAAPFDPTKARTDANRKLDDMIRREPDASTSGRGPGGAAGGQNGSTGPIPGDPGAGGGRPAFDRKASKERWLKTPIRDIKNRDAQGNLTVAVFSDLEIELLELDVAALKKSKPAERKKTLDKFSAVDPADLQKKRDVLTDRRGAWADRRADDEEKEWTAGQAKANESSYDAKKRKFLAELTGAEPWMILNHGIGTAVKKKKVGPWAHELSTTMDEVGELAGPTKAVVEKHIDTVMQFMRMIPPELVLAGTVAMIFVPKAMAAIAARKRQAAAPPPAEGEKSAA